MLLELSPKSLLWLLKPPSSVLCLLSGLLFSITLSSFTLLQPYSPCSWSLDAVFKAPCSFPPFTTIRSAQNVHPPALHLAHCSSSLGCSSDVTGLHWSMGPPATHSHNTNMAWDACLFFLIYQELPEGRESTLLVHILIPELAWGPTHEKSSINISRRRRRNG